MEYPNSYPLIHRVPRICPPSPPPLPLSTVTGSGPRTSVGADPHVLEDGAAPVAADDVDGAGSVDHGRVPLSATPRRVARAGGPGRACRRTAAGERPMAKAKAHGSGSAGAADDIHSASPCRTRALPLQYVEYLEYPCSTIAVRLWCRCEDCSNGPYHKHRCSGTAHRRTPL